MGNLAPVQVCWLEMLNVHVVAQILHHPCTQAVARSHGSLMQSHASCFPFTMAVQTEPKSKQSSEANARQKKRVPFYPPGYLHYPTDLLRSRFSRAECLAELEHELAAAWPQAFLQVNCFIILSRVSG